MTNWLGGSTTFIVRLARDEAGRLTGVVERVRTGEKARVHGLEGIGRVIARMVEPGGTDVAPVTPTEEKSSEANRPRRWV